MIYLNEKQLAVYLYQGRTIEYWLGFDVINDFETCKWIAIEKGREDKNKFYLIFHHVFNELSEDVNSIYDFSYVIPDDIYGKILGEFNTIEETIEFAKSEFNIRLDRFLPEGNMHKYIK